MDTFKNYARLKFHFRNRFDFCSATALLEELYNRYISIYDSKT